MIASGIDIVRWLLNKSHKLSSGFCSYARLQASNASKSRKSRAAWYHSIEGDSKCNKEGVCCPNMSHSYCRLVANTNTLVLLTKAMYIDQVTLSTTHSL